MEEKLTELETREKAIQDRVADLSTQMMLHDLAYSMMDAAIPLLFDGNAKKSDVVEAMMARHREYIKYKKYNAKHKKS